MMLCYIYGQCYICRRCYIWGQGNVRYAGDVAYAGFFWSFFLETMDLFSLLTINYDKKPLLLTIVAISFKWSQTWTCIGMLNTQNIAI